MMTHNGGGIGSGNVLFACGHENPVGNRFCNACGAARDQRCPLCNSLNQGHARFCGDCGARFLDEATAPETTVASPAPRPGSNSPLPDREKPPWSDRRESHRNTPLFSPIYDMAVEDEPEVKHRRREVYLAAAAAALTVAIAIFFGVEHFSRTRYGGPPESVASWPVADPGPASATGGGQPPAREDATSAASSAPEGETPTRDTATGESAREATEVPQMPRPRVPAPQTSEERVADYLIGQFGPAPAAEKALSTAAWYDADRSEHAYWERVAEAIRRRQGS